MGLLAYGCNSTWFTAGLILATSKILLVLRILKLESPACGVNHSDAKQSSKGEKGRSKKARFTNKSSLFLIH